MNTGGGGDYRKRLVLAEDLDGFFALNTEVRVT